MVLVLLLLVAVFTLGYFNCKYDTGGEADNGQFFNFVGDIKFFCN